MRMNELSRYLDKYIDFDSIGERIDTLQDRLSKLREQLPEASAERLRSARESLPSYQQIRKNLPFVGNRTSAMPAVVAVGGIAILAAIITTAVVMSDSKKPVRKRSSRA